MHGGPVRLLYVDDDASFTELVSTFFAEERPLFEVETVSDVETARERLEAERFDCVVSEYRLPGATGLDLLASVRENHPDLPVVFFTATGSERVAADAISTGVSDYLLKGEGDENIAALANRVEHLVQAARDEHRDDENALKTRVMDAAPVGIIITDPSLPDNGIVYANEAFEQLTGYDEAEILGKNCRFLQGPETDPERVAEMREAVRENEVVTVELRNYRKDGTEFWNQVTIAPIRVGDDEVTNYVGFQQQVTDSAEQRREQQAVFDRVSDAFFALDDEWRFSYLNDQAERLLDRSREELVGKSVWEEFPEAVGSTFETQYRTAVENQETVTFEEYYAPLGAWFEVRAYPSQSGLSVYFRDISQRKANERRLEQRAKQFETFGEVLSHDLKTPLLTLEGRLSLARQTKEDEQFDAAQRALERVRELVDGLATAMREGSVVNEMEPLDIEPLARELWAALDTSGGSLTVAEMGPILADEQALSRLLQNLFRNSVEHNDGEKEVTVTLGPLPNEAGFFVADTGPGIPEDQRERVFEPGYTTKEGGSGFGMVSVQQIAMAHGWDISVTENETGGARFEIRGVDTA